MTENNSMKFFVTGVGGQLGAYFPVQALKDVIRSYAARYNHF